jgi:ADP-ribosyl-[dinitrogen reductase] hydrolase
MNHPSKSAVLGTLVGGAVGDAMGAPFEGLWPESISTAASLASSFHEYHGYPRGQYTDDTQLTLATIQSIVDQQEVSVPDIARNIAELWRHQSVIGPGGACTQAAERYIATGDFRGMGACEGNAGNGTAMRTAALGLWFFEDHASLISVVADVSRITHQDSRSVAGGVAIAKAASLLSLHNDTQAGVFCGQLADACRSINAELADLLLQLPTEIGSPHVLDFLANSGQRSPEFDRPIISPFVIPTVLASIYSILTNPGSWIDAVTSAIRLGGDVDTLGAIVGALAGARHGLDAIPKNLVRDLQSSHDIQILAARYYAAIHSHPR